METFLKILIYGMVYAGSALMVYNILGFIRFSKRVRENERSRTGNVILYVPVGLLVFFLLGYLAVGVFGSPDLIVSGILFGGSIFVFVVYRLLLRVTERIVRSERKQAELTAHEESSRVKSEFLATVSHEMRTPMNVIIGLDAKALKRDDLPPETRTCLEKIGLSARHLLGLINNMLDMNRIESGELTSNPAPFLLSGAMNQVNAIVGAVCEQKGLVYRPSGDLPFDGCTGDEMLVKQVLLALLDNAVKYTDVPGEVALTVTEDRERGAADGGTRYLRFAVSDTGVGIDDAFQKELFTPFSKENAGSTDRHGGSGLGLALTKRLVTLMNGEITVDSKKGVGSVFTVILPLTPAASEAEKARPFETSDLPSFEGRRILICEDVPENAEIAADLLELEGAECERAENGQIGLELFSSSPPGHYDAILMDLRMPVMDGLTATREIRKLDRPDARTVPIVALTANAFESDVRNADAAGMDAHLAKPADADLLYSTLKRCIARAEAGRRSKE